MHPLSHKYLLVSIILEEGKGIISMHLVNVDAWFQANISTHNTHTKEEKERDE